MKLSLVIEAVDKASQRVKRITGNVRDLGTRGMGTVQRATQGANSRLQRFGSGFVGRVTAMTAAAGRFAGRMGMKAIEKAAYGAGYAIGWTIRKGAALAGAAIRWGTAGAAFATGWGIGGIIRTGAQFEDFQAVLEGTEGSVAKAKTALSWVQTFAQDTPYELAEVTDAFVRARGVGIDPMSGSFKALGDAASGARMSIMDAVEAIADAQTGEFERLKGFNITTSVAGSKVTFSYLDKAGKNMTRTVAKNMRDIQRTVLDIFADKYADGMIRRSRTLNGIWSNIKDKATGFLKMIADAGFFDVVKTKLQAILDQTDKMSADGSLAKWAKNISDWLVRMTDEAWRFVKETNWSEVAGHLKNVGKLVWWIVKGVSALVGLAGKVADGYRWLSTTRTSDLVGLTTPKKEIPFSAPKSTGKGWPARMSDSLRPVAAPRVPNSPMLRPQSTRAPVSGSPVAKDRKPVVRPEGYGSSRRASPTPNKSESTAKVQHAPAAPAPVSPAPKDQKPIIRPEAYRAGQGRSAWLSQDHRPAARVPNSPAIRQRQPVVWPEGSRSARSAPAKPMKGEITVKVEAAQGTRARVAKASASPNLSLNATSRGRAMESFG